MENTFINIVQKCICMDFLLNSLIDSNSYEYSNFLNPIKEKNLRNLKILCSLYRHIYGSELPIENVNNLTLNKNDNNLTALLEINLNIITELEYLKRIYISSTYFNIIQSLINSYFNFVSLINCFCPFMSGYRTLRDSSNNLHFFYMIESSYNNYVSDEIPNDLLKNISLEAINYFFDYPLSKNRISDEFYEVFFSNSPENKFYQYFFKSLDTCFKVRIFSKNGIIFYIYRSNNNDIDIISTPLSKEDAKNFTDNYLKEKFKNVFHDLLFDDSYVNISYYMNNIESYKFRYNYKYLDSSKNLYITVNAKFNTIQEITLF